MTRLRISLLLFAVAVCGATGRSRAASCPRPKPCPGASKVVATPAAESDELPGVPSEPRVRMTRTWLTAQLVPSPGVVHRASRAALALGWQVTPLAWSFGIDPRLSPLRSFVVEPAVRHSGSVELFAGPQYWAIFSDAGRRWGGRLGLRSYFPVLHRGEYLSASLSSSVSLFPGQALTGVEAGVHVLFGVLGLVAGVDAGPGFRAVHYELRVRVF